MRAPNGLLALAVVLGCSAEALESPVTIDLHSRRLVLDEGIDPDLRAALEAGTHRHVLAYVLFRRDVGARDHAALRGAGIDLLEYIGQDAYSAAIPAGDATPWDVLDALVRAATSVLPADKLSPALAEARAARAGAAEEGGVVGEDDSAVRVVFRRSLSAEEATRALEDHDLVGTPAGDGRTYRVSIGAELLPSLAADPRVTWIEPTRTETRFLGELARDWTNVDRIQRIEYEKGSLPKATFRGPSGAGVRIAICDNGIDENHGDFFEIGTTTTRIDDPGPQDNDGHGTMVASIAGGQGTPNSAHGYPEFSFRGHAPAARLRGTPAINDDLALWYDLIESPGGECDVSNHSYSISPHTNYDLSHHAAIDSIIRGDESWNNTAISSRPAVFAAGNLGDGDLVWNSLKHAGYYSIEAVSKNPIAVGSIDTFDGRVSRTSSLGPTIDGRLKPDLVAPGAYDSIPTDPLGLVGAASGGGHTTFYGTSIAAPVVSGVLALVAEQRNAEGVQPDAMSSATYKALLVVGARDAVAETLPPPARWYPNKDTNLPIRYHAGPDWATGFGVVDAPRSVAVVAEDRWIESVLSADGQQHVHCLSVPTGAAELRVALAWDDPPGWMGLDAKSPRLVNDLDLLLIDPCGDVVRPWILKRPPQASDPTTNGKDPIDDVAADLPPAERGPDPDRVNNVELVSLPEPKPGFWQIQVTAFDINDPKGGPQRYALATSHPIGYCLSFDPTPVPPVVPKNLCDRFPTLCSSDFIKFPPFDARERLWAFEPDSVLPLDELCKYVSGCPHCPGAFGGDCAAFTVHASRLRRDVTLHVFSDAGAVVQSARSVDGVVLASVDAPRPGRRYFVHFTDADGRPLRESLAVQLDFEPASDG